MKKTVLFDLDGTLTDSSEGIVNSVRYMLEKRGLVIPDEATLHSFIGPPLTETLSKLYDLTEKESQEAIAIYREYYSEKGIKQLAVYPGIIELLTELSTIYNLAIATSKPEVFANQIIRETGLSKYISHIFGADLVGERSQKQAVIAYALKELENKSAIMIGDREFDILGAKANHLKSIGVLYGFGDRKELVEAGADIIVEKVEDISNAVREVFFM